MDAGGIERGQVLAYLVAIGAGLLLGSWSVAAAGLAAALIWPALGLLLFVTFLQVPLTSLGAALADWRFPAAVLLGNFVLVPVLVWSLTTLAGLPPAVTLGVLLVLLVPCTDWYISFTQLAGGDAGAATAVTPLNLMLQWVLLPLYLWVFVGEAFTGVLLTGTVLAAFVTLIVVPLLAALLTARLAATTPAVARLHRGSRFLPVPLVALVVGLIATSQVRQVREALDLLPALTVVFVAFVVGAVALGWLLARGFRLPVRAARAAVLSLGTRNSFVVLPLALALPAQWQAAAVVIVYQSLVELLALAVLVWLVPLLLPVRPAVTRGKD